MNNCVGTQKKVFFVFGKPKSGKDFFISMVQAKAAGAIRLSIIDRIFEAAKMLGWDGIKNDRSRAFLNALKRASVEYNDYLFLDLEKKIATRNFDSAFVIFRNYEDALRLKKLLAYPVVFVLMKSVDIIDGSNIDDRVSYPDEWFDVIIDNTKREYLDLSEKVAKFIEEYLCG